MITEPTAKRLADVLERIAVAVERLVASPTLPRDPATDIRPPYPPPMSGKAFRDSDWQY